MSRTERELLAALLAATKERSVIWKQTAPDQYRAFAGRKIVAAVWFQYPMTGEEVVSGADIMHVGIGRAGMTFFTGSEGVDLVHQILRAGLPLWESHLSKFDRSFEEALRLVEEVRKRGAKSQPSRQRR